MTLIVRDAGQLSGATAQTPGMARMAAITKEFGADDLWAGLVVMEPDTRSGPHHHGDSESVIYMVSGRALFRWGEELEQSQEANPGDFIFIPPNLVHQEINPDGSEPLRCVVIRSGGENVVVNVDLPDA